MALQSLKEENHAPFLNSWKLFSKINDNFYVLYQNEQGKTIYAPLYVFSFCFSRPLKLTDAQRFLRKYPNPNKIKTIADKLRYYRYKKSLLQRDVADKAGIDRSTYISYETDGRDYYPVDKLKAIAMLYDVNVTSLLDDYNRFLYDGQGQQIRAIRKSMGLTQHQFGKLMGVSSTAVKRWEGDKVVIFKNTWEKVLNFA